jgi:aryl-alcohol dehydrogenase-like predicted oxidoreductase
VMRSGYEGALQNLCVAKGIAVLPFYGLASGFLTGKYRSAEEWKGSMRAHALDAAADAGGWNVLEAMGAIAKETGASHAQIALAWLNAQPGVAAPLASATSVEQVSDLIAAVSLELDTDQLARLDEATQGTTA